MWALSVAVGHARVALLPVQDNNDTSSPSVSSPLQRRDIDPADFGWIKRWAVIGDSFTAGIGAGTQLGKFWHLNKAGPENWKCSRYELSYPMVLNAAFGQGVEKFQFEACSGDRSEGIYKQVTEELENDFNLVVMTAGGNDLCLVSPLPLVSVAVYQALLRIIKLTRESGGHDQEMRFYAVSAPVFIAMTQNEAWPLLTFATPPEDMMERMPAPRSSTRHRPTLTPF
jgi:lysophospholipase L1-like esterase